MFKKEFNTTTTNHLKSSEGKKFRHEIIEKFKETEPLFPKSCEIVCTKLNNQISLYLVNQDPLFFETPQKTIIPTLGALLKSALLKPIFCPTAATEYLMNGADLMWAGVLLQPGVDYKKGEIVAIVAAGNPCPFAIGIMEGSIDNKGKACKIVHIFADNLWKFGKWKVPEGFTSTKIKKVVKRMGLNLEGNKEEPKESEIEELIPPPVIIEESEQIQQEKQDAVIVQCFIVALKNFVPQESLPCDYGFIWGKMLTIKPENTHLDLKKSIRFKKISKFLKEMETLDVCKFKEFQTNSFSITSINRNHPLYLDAEMIKKVETNKIVPSNKLKIHSVYKGKIPFLDKNKHYTKDEISSIVIDWLKDMGQNEKAIKVTQEIQQICPKLNSKECQRKKFVDLLIDEMTCFYAIDWPDGHRSLGKGDIPIIKIHSQMILGNKKITRVFGLKAWGFPHEDFAKECKTKFSTAVTFEAKDEAIKRKEAELEIHGNVSTSLGDYLRNEYAIPTKYLEITGIKEKK